MQKNLKVFSAFVVLGAMLAGCAANQGDLGNRNLRPNGVKYDANGNRITAKRFANDQLNELNRVNGRRLNSNNLVGTHDNYSMEMSQEIADALSDKHGIKSSYVLLTDNNAYVAVSFDDKSIKGKSSGLGRTSASYMQPMHPMHPTGQDKDQTIGDRNIGPDGLRNNGMYDAKNNGMAGAGTEDERLTQKVKDEVAREVKRMKPSVKNVYVSANPDFVSRMTSYANDVRTGHPIQGFIAEFNAMAERLFPARSGNLSTNSTTMEKRKNLIYD